MLYRVKPIEAVKFTKLGTKWRPIDRLLRIIICTGPLNFGYGRLMPVVQRVHFRNYSCQAK